MKYLDGPVLAVETSCDETSVAIVVGREILANVVSSQAELHKKWGGVVPEAAARKHTEAFLPVLLEALSAAQIELDGVVGVGVTNRPGLVGALSVGITAAKAIALARNIPLIGVHHLEGHLLSPLIASDVPFPHVCLLVSGGHTELVLIRGVGDYEKLGGTIDDAAGEAFDKAARCLGLGYPGGPAIQRAAASGDPHKYKLPKGLQDPTMDFSFAGLKTALLYLVKGEADSLDVASAAASFEHTIVSVLADRTVRACREVGGKAITLVGGVAANARLRNTLSSAAEKAALPFVAPPLALCTDNGAMIAHVASWRLASGQRDDFNLEAFPSATLPKGTYEPSTA